MQKSREENYFVKVNPSLLFDKDINWKSKYSPWLYACLKLDYNIYLQRKYNKTISIKYSELAELLNTRRETLSKVAKDLVDHKLLTKAGKNNNYSIEDDSVLGDSDGKNFVQIYNNFFIRLLEAGISTRQLKIYYYLIYITFHLQPDKGFIKSDETQTSIVKSLNSRGEEVKAAIEGLINLGLVKKNRKGELSVREQAGDIEVIDTPLISNAPKEEAVPSVEKTYEQQIEELWRQYNVSYKNPREQELIKKQIRELTDKKNNKHVNMSYYFDDDVE